MPNVWTHGMWTVKQGREEDFVAAWKELRRAALADFDPPAQPFLLRDRDRPNLFVSFGPWQDVETIERFRAAIGPRVAAMREDVLESFETFTLDEVDLGG